MHNAKVAFRRRLFQELQDFLAPSSSQETPSCGKNLPVAVAINLRWGFLPAGHPTPGERALIRHRAHRAFEPGSEHLPVTIGIKYRSFRSIRAVRAGRLNPVPTARGNRQSGNVRWHIY